MVKRNVTYVPRVTAVDARPNHVIHLVFDDGLEGDLDLTTRLWGAAFEVVRRDERRFCEVRLEGDGIGWPGAGDMAPEYLYDELAGQAGEAPLCQI